MPSRRAFLPVILIPFVAGCSAAMRSTTDNVATAIVRNASGTSLGSLRFEAGPNGVRMTGQLTGLPAGAHGIHLHAVGRCDAPEFTSAGGHFNPGMTKHGLLNPEGPHAGDLPAIGADASGRATVDVISPRVTLDEARVSGAFDVDGTSVVVHAANDDQRTDPSGNSGGRIACGVLERS